MKMRLLVVIAVILVSLAGCGGQGGRPERSSAVIRIEWPRESTRLIPNNTRSIRIEVRQAFRVLRVVTVPRPSGGGFTETVIDFLPATALTFEITAHNTSDASGVPVAKGSSDVTLRANEQTRVEVTLSSTVVRLTTSRPTVPMDLGDDELIRVTAVDDEERVVLTDQVPWQWTVEPADALLLNPNGSDCTVTALQVGEFRLTARHTDSNKHITITVRVGSQLTQSVTVLPNQRVPTGFAKYLRVEVRDDQGQLMDVHPSELRWTSLDQGILEFRNGLAYGISPGVATVVASYTTVDSAPVQVSVGDFPESGVRVINLLSGPDTPPSFDLDWMVFGQPYGLFLTGTSFGNVSPFIVPPAPPYSEPGVVRGRQGTTTLFVYQPWNYLSLLMNPPDRGPFVRFVSLVLHGTSNGDLDTRGALYLSPYATSFRVPVPDPDRAVLRVFLAARPRGQVFVEALEGDLKALVGEMEVGQTFFWRTPDGQPEWNGRTVRFRLVTLSEGEKIFLPTVRLTPGTAQTVLLHYGPSGTGLPEALVLDDTSLFPETFMP